MQPTSTPSTTRLADWPERLAAVVAAAQGQPYLLGQHDCLRFTCACVQAVQGVDLWPRFAGYTTKLQALRTIASIAPTLGQAVSTVLGLEPTTPMRAGRGDVLLYQDTQGEHLGVCLGATVAVLGPDGLQHVTLNHAGLLQAWRLV